MISLEDARTLTRCAINKKIEDQIEEKIIEAAKEGYAGVDVVINDPYQVDDILSNGTDDCVKMTFHYDDEIIKNLEAAGYAVYIDNTNFMGKDKGYSTLNILWYENANIEVEKQKMIDAERRR